MGGQSGLCLHNVHTCPHLLLGNAQQEFLIECNRKAIRSNGIVHVPFISSNSTTHSSIPYDDDDTIHVIGCDQF